MLKSKSPLSEEYPIGPFAFGIMLIGLALGCGGSTETGSLTTGGSGLPTRTPAPVDPSKDPQASTPASSKDATTTTVSSDLPLVTLPGNVLYFAESGARRVDYRYISPSGKSEQLIESLDGSYGAFAANPAVANERIFAYRESETSEYAILRGPSKDPAKAKPVVPPTYQSVDQMQITFDGTTLYFIARKKEMAPTLFKTLISGGSPEVVDSAESFHLARDGAKIVYAKTVDGRRQIFLRGVSETGEGKRLFASSLDCGLPQWNQANTKLVYSAGPVGKPHDLYLYDLSATKSIRLTQTPNDDELGASFSDEDKSIGFVLKRPGKSEKDGLYRMPAGGGNATLVRLSPGILEGTYWTSTAGRNPGGRIAAGMVTRGVFPTSSAPSGTKSE